jgi:hypothetical protein
VVHQGQEPAGDDVAGGLVAADEDEQRLVDDLVVVELVAVAACTRLYEWVGTREAAPVMFVLWKRRSTALTQ